MDIKSLFDDDRAVSPVIGVILMVAITVILAAVIGTFVLGLGDSLSESAPSATYDWSQNSTSGPIEVSLSHTGGDSIERSTVSASVAGNSETASSGDTTWGGDSEVTAGDTWTFNNTVTSGDDITVTWQSSEGGSSSVLTEYTAN